MREEGEEEGEERKWRRGKREMTEDGREAPSEEVDEQRKLLISIITQVTKRVEEGRKEGWEERRRREGE